MPAGSMSISMLIEADRSEAPVGSLAPKKKTASNQGQAVVKLVFQASQII
jgi:hypothetical protein